MTGHSVTLLQQKLAFNRDAEQAMSQNFRLMFADALSVNEIRAFARPEELPVAAFQMDEVFGFTVRIDGEFMENESGNRRLPDKNCLWMNLWRGNKKGLRVGILKCSCPRPHVH